ncbi:MAG: carbohydrate kinase, partial [Clostridia bacterium]|nr:carbohydrate kinase [Clostridia bacterium]
ESGLIFNSGTMENTYFYWGFIRTGGLSLRWFRDNVCDKLDVSKNSNINGSPGAPFSIGIF